MTERIRGRKLQELRKRHFQANPLCVMCDVKGIVRLATELDHIQALTNGGRDDGPRQGLCSDCHKTKTAQDMGYRIKVDIGPDGYPIGRGVS